MSAGYVLAEKFNGHEIYLVRAYANGRAEMSSRVGDARAWPTYGGARLAKRKYKLYRARVVKVPDARVTGKQLPLLG